MSDMVPAMGSILESVSTCHGVSRNACRHRHWWYMLRCKDNNNDIFSLIDCLIALRSSGYHYINFNFLTCQRNMLSICTYIQQIDSLQLFAIKLGQKGAAWARSPTPCPPHPGGSMSATFSHPPLPSRSLVELYLVVCFSCGKEEKVLMKRNRKTADGQTRGRGQRNRVQRRQRWK